jgi:dTDP-4-dehydrorhamnose 3,5-epimerase
MAADPVMFIAAEPTPLDGLVLLRRSRHEDDRGLFERVYCAESLGRLGLDAGCVQVNHSVSRSRGTLRGLHFQHASAAETKIVSCLFGALFDVAVDVRPSSPTHLQWYGVRLDNDAPSSLYVPPGFAHGFVTLQPNTVVLYASSAQWALEYESGIRYNDPAVGIDWPEPVTVLSDKDRTWPLVDRRRPDRNSQHS